jgi:hypothetical protein
MAIKRAFKARARKMHSQHNLLRSKSGDVDEPATPKTLATLLSPRAFIRRIRDQAAGKTQAVHVSRGDFSPFQPPISTPAEPEERSAEPEDYAELAHSHRPKELHLAFPLTASLRGLPIDPEVFDSTGSTPLNTGFNTPLLTPPLTPLGSQRFEAGDLARIWKDGKSERKRQPEEKGFSRFRPEEELKSALALSLPQVGDHRSFRRQSSSDPSIYDTNCFISGDPG